MTSCRSEVDTRRPFRSVKEAVAVFGDRLLTGEAYFRPPSPSYSTSSSKFNQDRDDEEMSMILDTMKKLEAELMETKREVTMLKAKMAAMDALSGEKSDLKVSSECWGVEEDEEIMEVKCEYLPTLAEVVRLGEADGDEFNGWRKEEIMKKKKKEKKKKKPIVPLIGNLFSRKKDYGETQDSLYCKSYF